MNSAAPRAQTFCDAASTHVCIQKSCHQTKALVNCLSQGGKLIRIKLFSVLVLLLIVGLSSAVQARDAVSAGENLFIAAAQKCDTAKMSDLISKGVDPSVTTGGDDMNAIDIAVYVNCSPAVVTAILKMGVDPNHVGNIGVTALDRLLIYNAQQAIGNLVALLNGGANPNLAKDGSVYIPLIEATKECLDCVEPLLKAGAKAEIKNQRGERPAEIAVQKGAWPVAELLFKAGANPNTLVNDGGYRIAPVCIAVGMGDAALIDRLVRYGADPKELDELKQNAVECGLDRIFRFGGPTIRQMEMFETSVQQMVTYGVDLKTVSSSMWSPLHKLVNVTLVKGTGRWINPERYNIAIRLTKFFVALGSPVDHINAQGRTPLASLMADRSMSEYLDHKLPDYFALANLLATKASVKILDADGQTALMALIATHPQENQLDIDFTRQLIALGIDVKAKNKSGRTAYQMAMDARLFNLAWELEQHGGK